MTHPTDDPLREALDRVSRIVACSRDDVETFDVSDIMALRDAALAAAPQPAPAPADERAAMIDVIRQAIKDSSISSQPDAFQQVLADALLAAGWTRGGDAAGLREAAKRVSAVFACRNPTEVDAMAQLEAALARPSAPETLAWGIVRKDGEIIAGGLRNKEAATSFAHEGERVVRVAIRVVEGGDDAV